MTNTETLEERLFADCMNLIENERRRIAILVYEADDKSAAEAHGNELLQLSHVVDAICKAFTSLRVPVEERRKSMRLQIALVVRKAQTKSHVKG